MIQENDDAAVLFLSVIVMLLSSNVTKSSVVS